MALPFAAHIGGCFTILCRSDNRLRGWPARSPAARAPWWLAGRVLLKIVYLLPDTR